MSFERERVWSSADLDRTFTFYMTEGEAGKLERWIWKEVGYAVGR